MVEVQFDQSESSHVAKVFRKVLNAVLRKMKIGEGSQTSKVCREVLQTILGDVQGSQIGAVGDRLHMETQPQLDGFSHTH